jgi:hypothetical protein
MLADASKGKEKEPRVPVQGQWKITRAEVEGEEGVDPVIVTLYVSSNKTRKERAAFAAIPAGFSGVCIIASANRLLKQTPMRCVTEIGNNSLDTMPPSLTENNSAANKQFRGNYCKLN